MKQIRKEITFFFTDNIEKATLEPIATEAKKRGYDVCFTDDILKNAEIGFYCQHLCFASNSKFSCVHFHDLGQRHDLWPNIWKEEFWSQFDIAFLPSAEWANMWHNASCYEFARPRHGAYLVGWAKSDFIFNNEKPEHDIRAEQKIDSSKKSILYAPSWEWGGRQLEMLEAAKGLDVNLLIKQAPWHPDLYPEQYNIVQDAYEKCREKIHGGDCLKTQEFTAFK